MMTLFHAIVSTSRIWVRLPPGLFYRSVVIPVTNLVSFIVGLVLMNRLEKRIKCTNRVLENNQRPTLAQPCSLEVCTRSSAMKAN